MAIVHNHLYHHHYTYLYIFLGVVVRCSSCSGCVVIEIGGGFKAPAPMEIAHNHHYHYQNTHIHIFLGCGRVKV